MALIPGNTHKTADAICANVVRKAYRVIGVHVRSHAGVRVHVPVYRDDAGVGEQDCVLIINHYCLIYRYNSQQQQAFFPR